MVRLLIWLLVALAGWAVWRARSRGAPPRGAMPPPSPPPPAVAEAMVDCARCGLHLPASEALMDPQGRAFCSAEHRSAGPARG